MAEAPTVWVEHDWRSEGLGRWLLVGPGKRMWDRLSPEAQEGLSQRAKMANRLALQNVLVDKKKVHPLQGRAKGSQEVILAEPLARAVGFKVGRPSDWYMSWFMEGQHPSKRAATEAGVRALGFKKDLGL
jgi:hypothetical protein